MAHQEDILQSRWDALIAQLFQIHKKEFSLEGVLMLVGLQFLEDWKMTYNKEEKKDLIHIGVCVALAQSGYYKHTHMDEEGWPHFTLVKPLPEMKLSEQENFLKDHLILLLQHTLSIPFN